MGNSGSAAVGVDANLHQHHHHHIHHNNIRNDCPKLIASTDLQQLQSYQNQTITTQPTISTNHQYEKDRNFGILSTTTERGTNCKYTRPKVLPDLGSPLRLRRTDNGDILHNGGTISARRQDCNKATFERDLLYGSEPDLRFREATKGSESIYLHDSPTKLRTSRVRKKYRAPKAPAFTIESSSPDSYQECNNAREEPVSRRLRLFKTRTECKKTNQDEFQTNNNRYSHPTTNLQRSLSTPHFDGELLAATTDRLRQQIRSQDTTGCESSSAENSSGWKNGDLIRTNSPLNNSFMGGHSGGRQSADGGIGCEQMMTSQRQSHEYFDALRNQNKSIRSTAKISAPVKRFYFGMNLNEDLNESFAVDNLRSKLQLSQDNIDGFISLPNSDTVEALDDDMNQSGISVQLRATLPRKQLDIPQFSPLTAWRLLSCGEALQRNDSNTANCEEELEVLSSPNNHLPHHHNHYHPHALLVDKSQDSGISADDSPRIDSQAAWTPQQDLEDTSSDGGFPQNAAVSSENCQVARFSPRFILSLPRDDRLNLYSDSSKDVLFGERPRKDRIKNDDMTNGNESGSPLIDSNWVLSRSMPSLLNTSSLRPSPWASVDVPIDDEELTSLVKQPSFSYLATGGHIMYLPQYSKYRVSDRNGRTMNSANNSLSKSCEDVANDVPKETAQTPPPVLPTATSNDIQPTKPERKFTFQSTIRQIERKRLADKLSKEAETKENERRLEVEAMRKAEEEFQRKREKEKVGIRQQLRLFSLSSSPTSTQILSEYHIPSREYREYRNKYPTESDSPIPENRKKSMIHPAVTYQIPKSTQIYFNPRINSDRGEESITQTIAVDNYRKKFAQGAVAPSVNNNVGSLDISDQTEVGHYNSSSFDNHSRGETQLKVKGAIPLIQSSRLSEGRPTGL